MISDILRRKCDRYDCSIGMVRCNVDRSIMCFNDSFGNCETKAGTVFFCCKEWFIKLINNFRWNTTAVILALNQNFIVKFLCTKLQTWGILTIGKSVFGICKYVSEDFL